jgi:hypothetical protein
VTITGETTGIIKTLVSGTSQYGNNLNCGWVINGGTGNRIQMLIGGVDLQSAPVYTSCGGYVLKFEYFFMNILCNSL